MIGFIDTHTHLHDPAFDTDRADVLLRARAAGLKAIITVGTDIVTSAEAVALAQHEHDVYATVGIHPHDARSWNRNICGRLAELGKQKKVVAIGEIGLDFYRNLSPEEDQRRAFRAQLALADALSLPVVVHSREAAEETFTVLKDWALQTGNMAPLGVLHCYSSDIELAMRYTELGFMISFAGPVTYPKNEELRRAAKALPSDRLVIETDCPYLSPQPKRGRRNEPSYVVETGQTLADLRGLPLDTFATESAAAARRLFHLPDSEFFAL